VFYFIHSSFLKNGSSEWFTSILFAEMKECVIYEAVTVNLLTAFDPAMELSVA